MLAKKNFLCLDYSLNTISCSIFKDEKLITSSKIERASFNSKSMLELIADVMHSTKLNRQMLDYILTTTGPGSFTAIRILLATTYGLSQSLDKLAYGFDCLSVMAFSQKKHGKRVIAVIRAYQNQFYVAGFFFDSKKILPFIKPQVFEFQALLDRLSTDDLICAEESVLNDLKIANSNLMLSSLDKLNLSEILGYYALEYLSFKRNELPLPLYLKAPYAEINFNNALKQKQKKWNR